MTKILTVANLKGGSSKTTSTVFIAHALKEMGLEVAMIDADPQGSLLSWAEHAEFEIPVVGKPVTKLHTQIKGIFGDRFDVILIDTPPLDAQAGIVYGALRAADYILVPMAPTSMEFHRLGAIWDVLDDLNEQTDSVTPSSVLLTRALANGISTRECRSGIEGEGRHVLSTSIPRLEAIGLAHRQSITALFGHDKVALELQERGAF